MSTNHGIPNVPRSIKILAAGLAGLCASACGDPAAGVVTGRPAERSVAAVAPLPQVDVVRLPVDDPLPSTAAEWVQLARRRLDVGDHRGAIESSDRALALEPARADALHQKGRALWGLDRGHEALVTLEAARQLDPANGFIANTTGYLLLTRGAADEAIPHLEAARDALPHVAYVRNNLGVAYERAGRLQAAVEEYRAAVATGDSGGKATASLARLDRATTAPLPLLSPPIVDEPIDGVVSVVVATEEGGTE